MIFSRFSIITIINIVYQYFIHLQQEILKTKQQMLRDDWEFHKKLAEKGMQRAQQQAHQQALVTRTQPDGKSSPSSNSKHCHHSGSRLAHHLVNGAGNGTDSDHKGTTTCKKK